MATMRYTIKGGRGSVMIRELATDYYRVDIVPAEGYEFGSANLVCNYCGELMQTITSLPEGGWRISVYSYLQDGHPGPFEVQVWFSYVPQPGYWSVEAAPAVYTDGRVVPQQDTYSLDGVGTYAVGDYARILWRFQPRPPWVGTFRKYSCVWYPIGTHVDYEHPSYVTEPMLLRALAPDQRARISSVFNALTVKQHVQATAGGSVYMVEDGTAAKVQSISKSGEPFGLKIVAVPKPGYKFVKWESSCEVHGVVPDRVYSFVTCYGWRDYDYYWYDFLLDEYWTAFFEPDYRLMYDVDSGRLIHAGNVDSRRNLVCGG